MGFGGRVFHLPPIPGDQRVGLSKRRLTFFHGAYFSLPTMYAARFRLSFYVVPVSCLGLRCSNRLKKCGGG